MIQVILLMHIDKVYGGAERRLCRILNEVHKDPKYETKMFLVGEQFNIDRFVQNEDISSFPIHAFPNEISCFFRLLLERKAIIWFFNVNHIGFMLSLFGKRGLLLTVANIYLAMGKYVNQRQANMFQVLCKRVSWIDCLYPSTTMGFRKKLSITPCPFTKLDKYSPAQKSRCIVFSARLIKGKNVELCLEAIKKIYKQIRERGFIVKICGDGYLRPQVEAFVQENNMTDLVFVLGQCDMTQILPESMIFLSLQDVTNYPSQVLLESISTGNYIVATNTMDTKQILDDSFSCCVEQNVNSIAEGIIYAIDKVLADTDRQYVKDARVFAEKRFNIDNSVEYFKRLFTEIFERLGG